MTHPAPYHWSLVTGRDYARAILRVRGEVNVITQSLANAIANNRQQAITTLADGPAANKPMDKPTEVLLTTDERGALCDLLDGVIECGPYDDTAAWKDYLLLLQGLRRKLGVPAG